MTPVFLVLLLAIVVGVGLVAAGRGGSIADVEPDAPPVGLPEGTLTRADIDAVRFPTALRGYRMSDVDDVLERLLDELDRRDAHIRELQSPQLQSPQLQSPVDERG